MMSIVSNRPQTLKQAKKAYRKSGATVRLSECELAIIERRAVLQERADRIKEREARRKENIKRKEEKIRKEREARQKMGMSNPVKGGIHVGPSQLHLGDFMAGRVKTKREETLCIDLKSEKECILDAKSEGCQKSPTGTPSSSNIPLRPSSTNANIEQKEGTMLVTLKVEDQNRVPHSSKPTRPPPSRSPRQTTCTSPKGPNDETTVYRCKTMLMGPPPRPSTAQAEEIEPNVHQKALSNMSKDRPPDTVDDCWDDFFVSNTQIARELSPPLTEMTPLLFAPTKSPCEFPISLSEPTHDTADLLDLLYTQDLDFSGVLTQAFSPVPGQDTDTFLAQISTQDLDFSSDLSQSVVPQARKDSSDFDEDLTEKDLEDFALELELQSSRDSNISSQYEHIKEEGFIPAQEYDGFDISTQDLRELET